MQRIALSQTRKFNLWFFDAPSNDPFVSLTFDVSIEPALEFLDAFEREHGERAGLQHLLTKSVAQTLVEVPALNVKILGRSIYRLDRVDIAMPVHLGGSGGGADETGMMILTNADQKSLLDIARETRRGADAERRGEATLSGSAMIRRLARKIPATLMYAGLDVGRLVTRHPFAYRLFPDQLSVSSAVTNVGAVFAMPKGVRFRAASTTVPSKATPVSSVFGVGPIEEAALVENGAVVPRKVLPIIMVVDHRAIDGVLMATAAAKVAGALANPAKLAKRAFSA